MSSHDQGKEEGGDKSSIISLESMEVVAEAQQQTTQDEQDKSTTADKEPDLSSSPTTSINANILSKTLSEWTRHWDGKSQRWYYHNPTTSTTTWTAPPEGWKKSSSSSSSSSIVKDASADQQLDSKSEREESTKQVEKEGEESLESHHDDVYHPMIRAAQDPAYYHSTAYRDWYMSQYGGNNTAPDHYPSTASHSTSNHAFLHGDRAAYLNLNEYVTHSSALAEFPSDPEAAEEAAIAAFAARSNAIDPLSATKKHHPPTKKDIKMFKRKREEKRLRNLRAKYT